MKEPRYNEIMYIAATRPGETTVVCTLKGGSSGGPGGPEDHRHYEGELSMQNEPATTPEGPDYHYRQSHASPERKARLQNRYWVCLVWNLGV